MTKEEKYVLGSIRISMIIEKTPEYTIKTDKDIIDKYKWLKTG